MSLPPYGEAAHCGREDCPAPDFEDGYGLAAGGIGAYEFCPVCERFVSRTPEAEMSLP